ncbi:MAG TPA: methionyl-tRNA formyltransferase [Pirellulales bacterium]|nr:methionyl-tRNA formyltransferase [Pirellulales bacterium]
MKLVIMGTGPFAVPTFRALYDSPHEVLALVTQPERAQRGGREPPKNPMRLAAEQYGTPILDPENINTDEVRAELARFEPELFVVADYGQILASETMAVAPRGGINLHGSLLPKYRGAAPINWALYNGDAETGVTVIHMTPRVDAGPCLAQSRTAIDTHENAVELERRLAALGAPLVCRTIDDLAAGHARPLPQDRSLASPARRLRKTDGQIDWSRTAQQIKNQIRALEPWPKTYTFWRRQGGDALRLILGRCLVLSAANSAVEPGTVIAAERGELAIATGSGALAILELQPAGKRLLGAEEFLRGYPVRAGDRFQAE